MSLRLTTNQYLYNDTANIPSNGTSDIVTIGGWGKVDDLITNRYLMGIGGALTNPGGFTLQCDFVNDTAYAKVMGDDGASTSLGLSSLNTLGLTTGWHHFIAIYKTNTASPSLVLYVDGVADSTPDTTIATAPGDPMAHFVIGTRNDKSVAIEWQNGNIAEAFVYEGDISLISGAIADLQTKQVKDVLSGASLTHYQPLYSGADQADAIGGPMTENNGPVSYQNDHPPLTFNYGLNDDPYLESFLKFDETTGTTASDETGLGNYSLFGNPTIDGSRWVTGRFGNALVRDAGNTNYAELSYDSRFNYLAYSVSFWIKAASIPAATNTIALRSDGNDGWAIYITNSGFIQWKNEKSNSPKFMTGTVDVTDDVWHHITVVTDGTEAWIYVDGIQDAYNADISIYTGGYTAANSIVLQNGTQIQTAMDDFRFYGRQLTFNEVRALANPYGVGLDDDPNLELYYKLDEQTGITATDSSSHARTVTMNQLDFATDKMAGPVHGGILRVTTNDRIVPGAIGLEDADQTQSMWVRFMNGSTVATYLISTRDATVGGLTSYISTSGDKLTSMIGTTFQGGSNIGQNLSDGKWHHVAVVHKAGDRHQYYIDGVLDKEDIALTGTYTSTVDTYISERSGATSGTDFAMDDIRIYSRALLAAEILELYNLYGDHIRLKQKKSRLLGV